MELLGILWTAAKLPIYYASDCVHDAVRCAVARCRARCAKREALGHPRSIRCKLCGLAESLWWRWYHAVYARRVETITVQTAGPCDCEGE